MERRGSRLVQYLAAISVSVAFVVLGTCSAWPSPVISKFNRNETNVNITKTGISWMLSVGPVGFIVGSFVTRFTSDKLGRRATILLSALPVGLGSVIIAFGLEAWLLCVAYFFWSCGTAMLINVNGIYLAEISDQEIRGSLVTMTRFAFNFGVLAVMAAGPSLRYETLGLALLPLPALQLAVCWWLPETPYFLLKEGREGSARRSLRMLRGYNDEMILEEELSMIKAGVAKEMVHSSTYKELFCGKQYRRAIIVAAGIKLTQIMTGGGTIRQYMGLILQEARVGKEYEQTVFLVFGGISFIVSLISSILVDRMGRRPLLICSYLGTGLCLAVIGVYFYLINVVRISLETVYGVIPFACIILSNVISSFGIGALSAVIPAEIFPINVKSVAMTSFCVFAGILGFSIGKGYQNVLDLLGQHAVFWIFALVAFGGAVFTYFLVPETRGKGLSEIQKELQGELYDGAHKDKTEGIVLEEVPLK